MWLQLYQAEVLPQDLRIKSPGSEAWYSEKSCRDNHWECEHAVCWTGLALGPSGPVRLRLWGDGIIKNRLAVFFSLRSVPPLGFQHAFSLLLLVSESETWNPTQGEHSCWSRQKRFGFPMPNFRAMEGLGWDCEPDQQAVPSAPWDRKQNWPTRSVGQRWEWKDPRQRPGRQRGTMTVSYNTTVPRGQLPAERFSCRTWD